MTEKLEKITVLDGYYASGDHECFVFDKHKGPLSHYEAIHAAYDEKQRELLEDAPLNDQEAFRAFREKMEEQLGPYPDDDVCRVYPNSLLPDDDKIRGRKGRWVIKVEFFPDDG